jgi:hypothetical protein
MATNKRDLKAYSRFDGTGRIVPGSTVLRRNKPKNGNWKETQAYECCDDSGCAPCTTPVILSVSIIGKPPQTPYIVCNGNEIIYTGGTCGGPVDPTWSEILFALNSSCASWLGVWEIIEDTQLVLNMNCEIAKAICPNGILSLAFPAIPD